MLDGFSEKQKSKKKTKLIRAADLFCGAGGSSNGLIEAVSELGYELELTAVNHWDIAIATHSKNHPQARHLCKAVDSVNPLELFPERRIHLLVASPECTHHSNARGGKPRSEQKRADAWDLKRWIEKLYIENLLIENVREFVNWGPLGANGLPLKSKRGVYFNQFIDFLKVLYRVEWRILNCADYGDATSRERFFLLARRPKQKKIVFPQPTHANRKTIEKIKNTPLGLPENLKNLKPWRSAREIIDWSLQGESIFNRKKPLSENTMKRIFAGLFKYSLKPLVMGTGGPTGQMQPRDAREPLRTILTDHRQNLFVPYLINLKASDRRDRSIDEPTFTQCSANHQMLVEPFLIGVGGAEGQRKPHNLDEPLKTIIGTATFGIIEPFLVQYFGGATAQPVDAPLPTITANYEHYGLAEPFIVAYHNGAGAEKRSHSVNEPLPTADTSNRFAVAQPFIVPCNHGKAGNGRAHSIDEPMKTITQVDAWGLIQPFLVRFNNNQGAESIDEPLKTLTTKDRYGLCIPQLGAVLDIRFRMLQPHELAAAMSFPKSYHFTGTRDQKVKQIGNAVCRRTAKALILSLLKD